MFVRNGYSVILLDKKSPPLREEIKSLFFFQVFFKFSILYLYKMACPLPLYLVRNFAQVVIFVIIFQPPPPSYDRNYHK